MLLRISSGISPRSPRRRRRSARPASAPGRPPASTRSLSAERLITQLEMMTSTELSGSGMFSISPFRNSTFSTPAFFWLSRRGPASRRSCRGHTPSRRGRRAWPRAARRSRRRFPGPGPPPPARSSASAVGLPQPSDARTAACRQFILLQLIVEIRRDRVAAGTARRRATPAARATLARNNAQGCLSVFLFDNFFDVTHVLILSLFAANDLLRLNSLVARAALGIQETEKLFQHRRVRRVAQERPFPLTRPDPRS